MADFAHLQDVMGGIQGATGLPTPVTWDGKGLDPNTLMPRLASRRGSNNHLKQRTRSSRAQSELRVEAQAAVEVERLGLSHQEGKMKTGSSAKLKTDTSDTADANNVIANELFVQEAMQMLEQQRAERNTLPHKKKEQRADAATQRSSSLHRVKHRPPPQPRFNHNPGDPDTDEETEDGPRFSESISPTSPPSNAAPPPLQPVDETGIIDTVTETAAGRPGARMKEAAWASPSSPSTTSSPTRQLVTLGRRQSPAQIASWGSPKPKPLASAGPKPWTSKPKPLASTGPKPWTRSTSSSGSPPIENRAPPSQGTAAAGYGRHNAPRTSIQDEVAARQKKSAAAEVLNQAVASKMGTMDFKALNKMARKRASAKQ